MQAHKDQTHLAIRLGLALQAPGYAEAAADAWLRSRSIAPGGTEDGRE